MSQRQIPTDVLYNDITFAGSITFGTAPTFPSGSFTDSAVAANAAIQYSKFVGLRTVPHEVFAEGASIISVPSRFAAIVRGTSGTQVGLDAVLCSSMTSPSSVVIDLQKGTIGSSVFASVLSTPISLGATSAPFTRYSATIASTGIDMTVGTQYRIVVTVAGTTANAAKGLWVSHTYAEAPA